jgi:hypothetical protein
VRRSRRKGSPTGNGSFTARICDRPAGRLSVATRRLADSAGRDLCFLAEGRSPWRVLLLCGAFEVALARGSSPSLPESSRSRSLRQRCRPTRAPASSPATWSSTAPGPAWALSSAGTPVFLDEYEPDGKLVESLALPTTANGANKPLVASGSASSEGLLTLSADDNFLMATGYDSAVGTAKVAATTSSSVPRTIARVSTSGEVNTTTALTDAASANNVRSATSSDGPTSGSEAPREASASRRSDRRRRQGSTKR